MLERASKKLLRFLASQEHNPHGFMLYSDLYDEYPKFCKTTEHRTMANLRYLESEGYIRTTNDGRGVELEHLAYRKNAFKRHAVISFLGKSIFTPIIVAILTTILTLISINQLQEALPEWLSRLIR